MHIKDHSAAMKFFRTYDSAASKGKWKEFVDEMEFDSMLHEPRTTAQEPRNMYAGGQLVQNTVDGSRPGYRGPAKFPIPEGYITAKQLAEELGISTETLKKYRLQNLPVDKYPLKGFIDETFKPFKGKSSVSGTATYYLKPTEKMLDSYFTFKNKVTISRDLLKDVETLHNSKLIKNLRKSKKKTLPTLEEVVKVLGKDVKAHGRAANAMATLSKMYKGEEYRLLKLPKYENTGEFIFKALRQGGKHNPYKVAFYNLAIGEIDNALGNEVGTLKNFKKYFKNNLTSYLGKGHGVSLNEVASISGMVSNDMAPYGAFVDLTNTKINNNLLANFQGDLSKALTKIDQLKGSEKLLAIKNFNESTLPKFKKSIADKYGTKISEKIKFTEIVPGKKLTDTYKAKDLATWKKQGIDLQSLAKEKGYYLDVKGARPYTEFLEDKKLTKVGKKEAMLQLIKDADIPCKKGVGGQCNSIADYQKGFNQLVKEAAAGKGSAEAIQKLKGFTKSMRALTGVAKWTGYGLLAEAGFMVPFAIGDYTAGKSWKRILGNATDYGFGPILGQSEQEEFEAALVEGSSAVEGEKVLELGERLKGMEEQEVNPGYGRIGYEKKAPEQRYKVYTDILEDYNLNLQPFMKGPAGQFFDESTWNQAHEEAAAARARIAAADQKRIDERTERGIIADRNWQSQIDPYYNYAEGGIASLMKKKW